MAHLMRLPGPVADNWEWQHDAACLNAPATIFFHPEHERGPARRNRDAVAVVICRACPVIEQCRRHALAVREPYGIWGGLTESDREAIYRSAPADGDRSRPGLTGLAPADTADVAQESSP